ncbi:unnamed protein product [Tuber melanosporum]|uniref:(Perigord truffle) hypothetical protein n=1 Tax=Tuber melanosporum (strain Mel28) TaxID=656061 RepID=D5GCX8_TUBMM|nr:uncharacterized protein GSTUM_00000859001 [Tuber melanosporum]CAZ82371.1 unnamed protein product [Tuber melanosporum]
MSPARVSYLVCIGKGFLQRSPPSAIQDPRAQTLLSNRFHSSLPFPQRPIPLLHQLLARHYGHSYSRKRFPKSHFYAFGTRHLICERDPQKHSEMKLKLSHGFSAKALLEQEDIVQGYVDKLIGQINVYATGPQGDEMVKWYNFFTFDLIGDLAFGQSFGSLNDAKPHFWVSLLLGNVREIAWWSVSRWFPLFENLGVWNPPKSAMEMRIKHSEYSRKMIIQHDCPRIIWPGQHNHVPSLPISILLRCVTLANLPPQRHCRFRNHGNLPLGHNLPPPKKPPRIQPPRWRNPLSIQDIWGITDTNAAKLKYLSAIIDEGLRIYPPVAIGTYRESPGETVDEIYIPKGVELSASPWSTCRSTENFHDPEEFKPERWLDPDCMDKHAS